MEARDNSNSKLSKPMNSFLAVSGQKFMRSQNDNINPNNRSRENLDDDNITTLQNMSELSYVKGRVPLLADAHSHRSQKN